MQKELKELLDSKIGMTVRNWGTTSNGLTLVFEDDSTLIISGDANFNTEEDGLLISGERMVQDGPYKVEPKGILKDRDYKLVDVD